MSQHCRFDASRSLTALKQDSTIIAVITADRRAGTRKTMIVALARKLLIALWRLVTRGEVPQGLVLRPAS